MEINFTEELFIRQLDCCPNSWDLLQRKKGFRRGQYVDYETPLAFGMPLHLVVSLIVDTRLNIEENNISTIKEYVEKYKGYLDEAINVIKKELKENKL